MTEPSTSAVKRAGQVLRREMRGDQQTSEDIFYALDVLRAFRAAHQLPLTTAGMGLRSMVRTEGCKVEVSQRLKRVPTIVDKLVREPTLPLSNMQDIGGCRAVLESIDEVRRVQARLMARKRHVRVSDYITEPRASGYRGVHVIMNYRDRKVEVQLRTRVMHEWAITVERLSGRLQQDVKSGLGPVEVQDLLQAVSEAMALEETGNVVEESLLDRMAELRIRAVRFLGGA